MCNNVCIFLFFCFFCNSELFVVDYTLRRTEKPLKADPNSDRREDMLEDMDDNQEERNKGLKIHMTFDHTVSSLLDDKIISVAPALYNFLYSPRPERCLPQP